MRGQRKNPRKAVQPFENKKRKIDIFKNYEANGVEKIQRKLEIFSTLISKKSRQRKNIVDLYRAFPIINFKKIQFPKLWRNLQGIAFGLIGSCCGKKCSTLFLWEKEKSLFLSGEFFQSKKSKKLKTKFSTFSPR